MGVVVTLDDVPRLTGQHRFWAYCGLDCTGTREVFDALYPRLDEQTARTYAFERALQKPALAMMRRGVLVDEQRKKDAVAELQKDLLRVTKELNKLPLLAEVWDLKEKNTGACRKNPKAGGKHKWPKGEPDETRHCEHCATPRMKLKPFNPSSPPQCKYLFETLFQVKHSLMRKKDGTYGVDEDVLRRIAKAHPKLAALCFLMLEYRGYKKQLGFLKAKLTPDGRYPSSFNVGAAWTGRWSSSKNPFGLGGNMQNIAERHRHIFKADPGYEMFYADLKQAESLLVAHLAGDEKYILAHTSGDTHTFVARLLWPDLPWTGDLAADKKVAKTLPEWDQAPGHDYRFQAKRIQHGGNYGLSPNGIALIAKIPLKEAKRAYLNYHDEFPYIAAWQRATKQEVQTQQPLDNPALRRIRLFGRPWDEHTYKQGLSYRPQSGVAEVLDVALYRLWELEDPWMVQLLAQVHDAILGQYKEELRPEAVASIVEAMTVPVPIVGADGKERTMVIPVEVAVGKNWGKKSDTNPHGLVEIEI